MHFFDHRQQKINRKTLENFLDLKPTNSFAMEPRGYVFPSKNLKMNMFQPKSQGVSPNLREAVLTSTSSNGWGSGKPDGLLGSGLLDKCKGNLIETKRILSGKQSFGEEHPRPEESAQLKNLKAVQRRLKTCKRVA